MGILSDTDLLAETAASVRPATHGLASGLHKAGVSIQYIRSEKTLAEIDTIVVGRGDLIRLDYTRSNPYVDLLFRAASAPELEHFVDRIRSNPSAEIVLTLNRLLRLMSWSTRGSVRRG